MKITANENRLLWALRYMVGQHLGTRKNDDQVFNSGFIRTNRTAMEILVEYGHMTMLSEDESSGRWYEARMVPGEQTPNAFGRDVDGGSGDPVEAMVKSADVIANQVEHLFDESPLQKHLREMPIKNKAFEEFTDAFNGISGDRVRELRIYAVADQVCNQCRRRYNSEYHSTVCPHRGIGFCAVCDCVMCVCTPDTAGDWERSNAYRTETINVKGIE